MVRQEDAIWRAEVVDLDFIAKILGTAGKGERQKLQHEKERIKRSQAFLKRKELSF